jgi:hypothetical protein
MLKTSRRSAAAMVVPALVALLGTLAAPDLARAEPTTRVYWTEWVSYNPSASRIARADVDGGTIETLVDGLQEGVGAKDLAIDAHAGKLYFANPAAARLERVNLDGSDRETLLEDVHPVGLGLDLGAGRIYWTDYTYSHPRICRAGLDGSGLEQLVETGDGCVLEGLVLDLAAGHVYWAERMAQHIKRANLDGSGAITLLTCSDGIGHPWGLALAAGRLYWASDEAILSANLDGEDLQTVIDGLSGEPRSLEYDLDANQLYWVTGGFGGTAIQRMNPDGTGLETLLDGLNYGYGLALEPGEPIAAPDSPAAVLALLGYPNPFNPACALRFELPTAQRIRLEVIGLDGSRLATLVDGWRSAGPQVVRWDGRDARARPVPSGVYRARLVTDAGVTQRAMTLVR